MLAVLASAIGIGLGSASAAVCGTAVTKRVKVGDRTVLKKVTATATLKEANGSTKEASAEPWGHEDFTVKFSVAGCSLPTDAEALAQVVKSTIRTSRDATDAFDVPTTTVENEQLVVSVSVAGSKLPGGTTTALLTTRGAGVAGTPTVALTAKARSSIIWSAVIWLVASLIGYAAARAAGKKKAEKETPAAAGQPNASSAPKAKTIEDSGRNAKIGAILGAFAGGAVAWGSGYATVPAWDASLVNVVTLFAAIAVAAAGGRMAGIFGIRTADEGDD